jgi:ribosome biogenesis GTPase
MNHKPVPGNTHQGTVTKKNIGFYTVRTGERTVRCELSNRLRKELVYPIADPSSIKPRVMAVRHIQQIDPVAVGDQVRFLESPEGGGLIVEVLPRRSKLSRPEATGPFERHAFEQVIVANLDQVVAVLAAAQPSPKWNLLDRYLVSAESLDLPALVCITKMDLAKDDEDLHAAAERYRAIGYPVVLTSAVTGAGIDALRQALHGRLSVLIGKSGVGKSSLLNAVQPGLGLRINAVNDQTGKGRHTTTNVEMIPLDGADGGSVIDTPGMREFGLWQVNAEELALFFPEMRPFVGKCKYGLDCAHEHEPGCAIRQAVDRGEIAEPRYLSMLGLRK